MINAVLWMDGLAISLLWPMLCRQTLGRRPRGWFRTILAGAVDALPALVLLGAAAGMSVLHFTFHADRGWFWWAMSLLAAHALTCTAILLARGRNPENAPAITVALLALSLLVAFAVGGVTLEQMDAAVRVRCALRSDQAQAIYLSNLPPISAEAQNAALLYPTIFERLKDDEPQDMHNPPLGDSNTFDPHEPATHAFLARQAETIALLHRAATQPCRFEEDLLPLSMDVLTGPKLNRERNAANVLSLHARQALADGDVAAAMEDANAEIHMGQQFGERPLLIHALVGAGIRALGLSTLQEALPAIVQPSQLDKLRLNDVHSSATIYRQAMLGEERFGLAIYGGTLGDWTLADMSGPSTSSLYARSPMATVLGRNFLFNVDAYIQLIEEVRTLASKPYFEIRPQVSQLLAPNPTADLLANIEAPTLARSLQMLANFSATEAAARVAVAMTRYRLDHSALPTTLNDLVPAYLDSIPIDPGDGKPLRLAIRGGDYLIYSVGTDGVDDGGAKVDHGKGGFILHSQPTTYPTTAP